jgi:hypothetical protein
MTTWIYLTESPSPTPTPLFTLMKAVGLSLLIGGGTAFAIGMFATLAEIVFPSLGFATLAGRFGVSENEAMARLFFALSAAYLLLFTTTLFSKHFWRVPVYNLRMGALNSRLRKLRRRLPGQLNRGYFWGALNFAAVFAVWSAILWLQYLKGDANPLAPPSTLSHDLVVVRGLLGVLIIGLGTIFLILNGARLIGGASAASRFFAGLWLSAAPYLALMLSVFAGSFMLAMALGLDGSLKVLALVSGLGGIVCGLVLWWRLKDRFDARVKAMALPDAHNARWADRRAPILFLRSFQDDSLRAPASLGLEDVYSFEDRLEDSLAEVVGKYGPVIAVGQPGVLPATGAARAYYQGDDWREAVTAWMDQALFILMVAGFTEGVRWELDAVIARGHSNKLILIFPMSNIEARYAWVRDRFQGHPVSDALREVGADCVAMHLDRHGEPVALASSDPYSVNYKAALSVAIYGLMLGPNGALDHRHLGHSQSVRF